MASENIHDLVIYRVNGNGLEVFLLPETAGLAMPKHEISPGSDAFSGKNFIRLDPIEAADGTTHQAIAVEADWHEIPSLRALIHEDYRVAKGKLKEKIKEFLPSSEQGAYIAVKDAFKKVAPEQYQFLKELKDILLEKNSVVMCSSAD